MISSKNNILRGLKSAVPPRRENVLSPSIHPRFKNRGFLEASNNYQKPQYFFHKRISQKNLRLEKIKKVFVVCMSIVVVSLPIIFLPKIIPEISFSTKIVNPEVVPSMEENLKNLLGRDGFIVNSLEVKNDEIFVNISGNLQVHFSQKKDLSEQVASLQLIISQSKIEQMTVKTVDFRFDRPVVTY